MLHSQSFVILLYYSNSNFKFHDYYLGGMIFKTQNRRKLFKLHSISASAERNKGTEPLTCNYNTNEYCFSTGVDAKFTSKQGIDIEDIDLPVGTISIFQYMKYFDSQYL